MVITQDLIGENKIFLYLYEDLDPEINKFVAKFIKKFMGEFVKTFVAEFIKKLFQILKEFRIRMQSVSRE